MTKGSNINLGRCLQGTITSCLLLRLSWGSAVAMNNFSARQSLHVLATGQYSLACCIISQVTWWDIPLSLRSHTLAARLVFCLLLLL